MNILLSLMLIFVASTLSGVFAGYFKLPWWMAALLGGATSVLAVHYGVPT